MSQFFPTDQNTPPLAPRDGRPAYAIVWEVTAVVLALVATFLVVCLVLPVGAERHVGRLGHLAQEGLRLLFGNIVAFVIPAFLLLLAVQLFLGKRPGVSALRVAGMCLVLPALAGMLALPYADDPNYAQYTISQAGVLGSYMVEWHGLRLVGGLGTVGAGFVLAAMALVGLVMLTALPPSQIAAILWAPLGRLRAAVGTQVEEGEPSDRSPAATKTAPPPPAKKKEKATNRPLFYDDPEPEPEPEPEPAERGPSLLARLLGRGKPTPEVPADDVTDDGDFTGFYDEDALAAARALEEARIDEEYERALREEAARQKRAMAEPEGPRISVAGGEDDDESDEEDDDEPRLDLEDDHEFAAEVAAEEEILISNGPEKPAEHVTGNPHNQRGRNQEPPLPFDDEGLEVDGDPAGGAPGAMERGGAALNLGGKLADMFPTRWSKTEEGETVRRDPNAKGDEEIRDAAEERELRRRAHQTELEGEGFDLDDDPPWEDDGESDPLFDENLETRPRGVAGALEESSKSAMEKDAAAARRNHLLAQYRLPDVELLDTPPRVDVKVNREEMLETSQTLEHTLADFNIPVKVTEIKQGPVVTRYEIRPAPGIKVSRIVNLEDDLAMAMRAVSVRIVAPIPGKAAVGIEVPNRNRQGVYLRELVSQREFWEHPSPLAFCLGKTIDGGPYFADLKKMPHLLIAGATGAGKSVCLNTIICSLLYRQRPDRLRLIMVDPKRVELSIYQDIPHLISPVVCDAKRAAAALSWAVEQMEQRYETLVQFNVRNIDGYNALATDPEKQGKLRGRTIEPMPHMVVIVDELADLMVVAKNEVEESIQRLAQMARAVGIHLILATQRPSVNVITGIIKANFPTRIAFQVSQKVDSRTILDGNGAESLLGRGDMLFAAGGASKPMRLQGAFLSDEEVERIADFTRQQTDGPMYEVEEFEPLLSEKEQKELAKLMGNPETMDDLEMQSGLSSSRGTNRTMGKVSAGMFVPHEGGSAQSGEDEIDEALVRAAAKLILEARKGSTSLLQRRLKVGFARAGRLMDMLEEMGLVGPYKGSKPRDLLVDCDAALEQLERLEAQIAANGGDSKAAAEEIDEAS